MKANKSTKRNPKDCNLIATSQKDCNLDAISHQSDFPARKEKPKGFARSQIGYWKKALRVSRAGNFMVQIAHDGRRGRFTFERNAEEAAEKARQIFLCIQKEGWEAAIARFSPRVAASSRRKAEKARVTALEGRIEAPTIGDLLRVAGEFATVRPSTFHGYAKALRFVVSEVFSVSHVESVTVPGKRKGRKKGPALVKIKDLRHDYRTGGLAKWRGVIDGVKLADLTPDKVESWRKAYLERAGTDPQAKDRAQVSFNKTIRNAKALFGKKLLALLEKRMVLARPLPFAGVAMEKEAPMRYQSHIDPGALLEAASTQLEPTNPEAYKALVLCLVLGLRRTEADTLQWRQVDFDRREVTIEPTEYYWLKSRDSARVLALDDASLAMLRGWHAREHGAFVLESPLMPRPMARTPVWRCNTTFKALGGWLKKQGVTARKPIHELRKEAGTILLKQGQPIESVSRYLGHSTIGITLKHYADLTKRRATVDLAALMPAANVAKFPAGESTSKGEEEGAKKAVSGRR